MTPLTEEERREARKRVALCARLSAIVTPTEALLARYARELEQALRDLLCDAPDTETVRRARALIED